MKEIPICWGFKHKNSCSQFLLCVRDTEQSWAELKKGFQLLLSIKTIIYVNVLKCKLKAVIAFLCFEMVIEVHHAFSNGHNVGNKHCPLEVVWSRAMSDFWIISRGKRMFYGMYGSDLYFILFLYFQSFCHFSVIHQGHFGVSGQQKAAAVAVWYDR